MLKYKLCRICMKQKKASTTFVKIFESTEMGAPVDIILTDFAKVTVDQSDDLPHIICTQCFDNLIKCREFQKLVVQNAKNLGDLARKPSDEMEKIIAAPLVRIEKVQQSMESKIVMLLDEDTVTEQLDEQSDSRNSSSDDEDGFTIEEEMPEAPIEAVAPKISCCCCPLQFSEEHDIIQHMKTDHSTIRSKLNIEPVDKDPKEVKQCELCFKYVVGMDKLLEHQTQFKNCKQCVECGGFYQKKTSLNCQCKKSNPTKYNQIKPVKCDICLNYYRNMTLHKQEQHGNKLLKCKQCDFTNLQKSKLIRHVAKFHIEKTVPCPYAGCGKLFVSSNCHALKLHKTRHTGERKFTCKYCGKTFSDNSDCKRHEWQHAGVSPYMCSKCNKMFLRKNHLLAHEEKCTN